MSEFKIPKYTDFLNDEMEGSDSLLKDFSYIDSIEMDQSQAATGARNTSLDASGSDIEQVTYDFDQPIGLRMYYRAASNNLPLGYILPVGIQATGLGGAIFQHGTETIQVEVAGQGEGLGERWAIFTSDFATHAFYFGLFDNDDGTYELRGNVPYVGNLTIDGNLTVTGTITGNLVTGATLNTSSTITNQTLKNNAAAGSLLYRLGFTLRTAVADAASGTIKATFTWVDDIGETRTFDSGVVDLTDANSQSNASSALDIGGEFIVLGSTEALQVSVSVVSGSIGTAEYDFLFSVEQLYGEFFP